MDSPTFGSIRTTRARDPCAVSRVWKLHNQAKHPLLMSSRRRGRPGGSAETRRDAPRGRRRVRFQQPEEIEEEEEEEEDSRIRRRQPTGRARPLPGDDNEEEEEEEEEEEDGEDERGGTGSRRRQRRRRRERGERGGFEEGVDDSGVGGDDDDDDEEDNNVRRMVKTVHGEEDEDEHYERMNEAGDPIEPFNLRNERDIGYFDTNGNFVWKKEQQEPDAWLAEMDEGTVEEAIGSATNRAPKDGDAPRKRSAPGDSASGRDSGGLGVSAAESLSLMGTAELREALIPLLLAEETVVQALRRLGARSKGEDGRRRAGKEKRARSISGSEAGGGKSKRARLNSTMDPSVNHTTMPPQDSGGKDMGNGSSTDAGESNRIAGGESGSSEMEKEAGTGEAEERAGEVGDKEGDDARKADFGRLTDLADALLQAGQHDIYQQTKEELEEAAAAAAAAHAARAAVTASYFDIPGAIATQAAMVSHPVAGAGAADSHFFEYRGKDGNVHGPYGASQMKQWVQQGYFDGEQAVMMRRVSAPGARSHASVRGIVRCGRCAKAISAGGVDETGSNVSVKGTTSGASAGSSSEAVSSADLMADLDDDEDEEEAGEGGEKDKDKGDDEEKKEEGAEKGTTKEASLPQEGGDGSGDGAEGDPVKSNGAAVSSGGQGVGAASEGEWILSDHMEWGLY